MAILTLEELKQKHSDAKAKKVLSFSEIQREAQTRQQTAGNQFTQASTVENPQTFGQKARNFATGLIGGGKLAEGLGMGLAAPKVQDDLLESQIQGDNLAFELRKKIQEYKDKGFDSSRLEAALADQEGSQEVSQDTQRDFVNALPTNKEVIGSAARLGGTLAGGAIAGGFAKATALGKATTALGGATRGAIAGAGTGAVEGVIQGAGIAAEQDKSTEEILYGATVGGVGGAITGGLLGGAIGGITGGLKGRAIKKEQFATDLVSPKMSVKDRAEAIRQGRLDDPSLFGKAEIQASKRDAQLADAVQDVVSPKATIGENVDAIRMKISQTNQGVHNYIRENKVPYNTAQLQSKLETGKDDLSLIFASDSSAEKTYDAVVDAFMKNVQKKDTEGLFLARQDFDKIPAVRKLLESDRLGENARKEIVLAVRRSANEYIANQLPKGNQYRNLLMQESHMLEALGNLADKSATIIGKNKLQMFTNEYPFLKYIISGLIGAGGVAVGGTLVSSSD